MPAALPYTSTYALTNATLSYVLDIADHGLERAAARASALRAGVNVLDGHITHPGVASAFNVPLTDPLTVFA